MKFKSEIYIAGTVSVIIISTLLSFIATGNGLNYSIDSYFYLGAAQYINIFLGIDQQPGVTGDFLKQLLLHYDSIPVRWPPLYPILLAITNWFWDGNVYTTSRYLHFFFPMVIGCLIWAVLYKHKVKAERIFLPSLSLFFHRNFSILIGV